MMKYFKKYVSFILETYEDKLETAKIQVEELIKKDENILYIKDLVSYNYIAFKDIIKSLYLNKINIKKYSELLKDFLSHSYGMLYIEFKDLSDQNKEFYLKELNNHIQYILKNNIIINRIKSIKDFKKVFKSSEIKTGLDLNFIKSYLNFEKIDSIFNKIMQDPYLSKFFNSNEKLIYYFKIMQNRNIFDSSLSEIKAIVKSYANPFAYFTEKEDVINLNKKILNTTVYEIDILDFIESIADWIKNYVAEKRYKSVINTFNSENQNIITSNLKKKISIDLIEKLNMYFENISGNISIYNDILFYLIDTVLQKENPREYANYFIQDYKDFKNKNLIIDVLKKQKKIRNIDDLVLSLLQSISVEKLDYDSILAKLNANDKCLVRYAKDGIIIAMIQDYALHCELSNNTRWCSIEGQSSNAKFNFEKYNIKLHKHTIFNTNIGKDSNYSIISINFQDWKLLDIDSIVLRDDTHIENTDSDLFIDQKQLWKYLNKNNITINDFKYNKNYFDFIKDEIDLNSIYFIADNKEYLEQFINYIFDKGELNKDYFDLLLSLILKNKNNIFTFNRKLFSKVNNLFDMLNIDDKKNLIDFYITNQITFRTEDSRHWVSDSNVIAFIIINDIKYDNLTDIIVLYDNNYTNKIFEENDLTIEIKKYLKKYFNYSVVLKTIVLHSFNDTFYSIRRFIYCFSSLCEIWNLNYSDLLNIDSSSFTSIHNTTKEQFIKFIYYLNTLDFDTFENIKNYKIVKNNNLDKKEIQNKIYRLNDTLDKVKDSNDYDKITKAINTLTHLQKDTFVENFYKFITTYIHI